MTSIMVTTLGCTLRTHVCLPQGRMIFFEESKTFYGSPHDIEQIEACETIEVLEEVMSKINVLVIKNANDAFIFKPEVTLPKVDLDELFWKARLSRYVRSY